MDPPLLELAGLSCSTDSGQLFSDLDLSINDGDIIVLQGRSGTGKTTLLKCISHLIQHEGTVRFRGSTARDIGMPFYRTKVLYVPQRPSLLPGSPSTFLKTVLSLGSQNQRLKEDHNPGDLVNEKMVRYRSIGITNEWSIEPELWERDWSNLSGGEAQRMLLAIALALNTAEVLLLDEPTSALDEETSLAVEKFLVEEVGSPRTSVKAILWITHSAEQGRRIGTRFARLSGGKCLEGSRSPSLSV
ncbi:P-loop containing nucleoside triphosphate hydrolase protein [Coprinopsis marcescibilis]|uniref:P-loop containing nucleoside triphosphate hydrolase protein n=1 Tax=Coprinopsis marcescibilis TaxID=230819 RepID=A0A5C3LAS9_COPMA|nr:P-loop containing nucleoside triphosphate hydrolase protein [Coprinopsis marcescibilis]